MAGRRAQAWRWGHTALLRAGITAALIGLVAACGTSSGGAGPGGGARLVSEPAGTISETGSSLLYPLMHSWATAYQKQAPGVTVTTVSSSSGAGSSIG